MKLAKKEIDKVNSTSKAQSINSSRMSSRLTSRKGSRLGSMDGDEESKTTSTKTEMTARSAGGKIINRLEKNEERDNNQMELTPDAFAAEQTLITEDEIKLAQERKGSYDQIDQDMDETKID
jgi:hypothetical protein